MIDIESNRWDKLSFIMNQITTICTNLAMISFLQDHRSTNTPTVPPRNVSTTNFRYCHIHKPNPLYIFFHILHKYLHCMKSTLMHTQSQSQNSILSDFLNHGNHHSKIQWMNLCWLVLHVLDKNQHKMQCRGKSLRSTFLCYWREYYFSFRWRSFLCYLNIFGWYFFKNFSFLRWIEVKKLSCFGKNL